MAAANSPDANGRVRGGLSRAELRVGDRLVWDRFDGARIFVIVARLRANDAFLRCHERDRVWTRREDLPLFPSIVRKHWTTEDLKASPE